MPPERAPQRAARVGLPWQLVGVAAPLVLAALLGLAWYAAQLAERATARAAAAHLIAVRTAAEAGAAAELARLEEALRRLAVDARTAAALAALADATRASEDDPRAEASQLGGLRSALLAQRARYFAPLLAEDERLDVATLLPTARRAIWLQAQFLPGAAPPADGAYAAAHADWHSLFAEQAARAGFVNLALVRASDGVVVYDVGKTPLFQTSLLDGPFADSHLGALARRLRSAPEPGVVRLADFAPFAADAGAPRAAIAAPVLVGGRPDGIIIATIDGATLTRALSVGERWNGLGLGARGDVVLVGADGTLRSEPRQARASGRSAIARRALPPSLQQAPLTADALRAFSDDDQTPMLAAVGQPGFGDLGWRAVATIDARAARQESGSVTARLVLAALTLAALISAALAALAWWLAVPLRHLGAALARFRPADPTAHLPALGRGDAAALATQVNHVLAQLRGDVANARRGRAAETAALVRVVDAWRSGDRAPRAYAGGELAALAASLNGLADTLAAPAAPMVPLAAAEALTAAAEHLRGEAARHLDAVGAAAAAARSARERGAQAAQLAQGLDDGSRQARAAAQAGQRAIAQLDEALASVRLGEAAAALDRLGDGSEVSAALADQLAVLAVNAALVAARDAGDAGDSGALAAEARAAAERASGLGQQLGVVRAQLAGVADAPGCAAAADAARREVDRAAEALARCSGELDALLAALRDDGPGACADAVQSAHNAARRLCQAADLLAREAAALGNGTAAAVA